MVYSKKVIYQSRVNKYLRTEFIKIKYMHSKKSFPRYVRLSWAVLVMLLSAFVYSAPGDNRALASQGATATQSSLWTRFWPPSNCIDGDLINGGIMCHSHRVSLNNEWLDIKLPERIPIQEVKIYNRITCCKDRAHKLWVMISDQPFPGGRDANSLAQARSQATFEFQLPATTQNIYSIPVSNVYGRYVRVQKPGAPDNVQPWLNLTEVQVIEGSGNQVELAIQKSVSDLTPAKGDVITFELEVSNAGPAAATNVSVKDVLPSGFEGVSGISDDGQYFANDHEVRWTIPSLPVGQTKTVSFQVTVK